MSTLEEEMNQRELCALQLIRYNNPENLKDSKMYLSHILDHTTPLFPVTFDTIEEKNEMLDKLERMDYIKIDKDSSDSTVGCIYLTEE
jgi:hypothetical protein